jgi:hypothetical protein
MKNKIILLAVIAFAIMIAGCKYDNYDPPTSILSGKVVYNSVPVGVRSNGTQLELWQYTWDTKGKIARAKIAVYIAQDGFYSAKLFDGNYKIVRLAGAPWSNPNTDSLDVTVNGNTTFDVPVTPYYTISGETFTYNKADSSITSTCSITKVGTNAITNLTLYAGVTSIVDNTNTTQNNVLTTGLTDLTTPKTNKITLTSVNKKRSYIYVRLAIQISGVSERYYTQVQKISLQ